MGFFINDLHQHIDQLHKQQFGTNHGEEIFTCYRGQGISEKDFDEMIRSKGGLMSFNHFLSTSKERDVSLFFAESNLSNPTLIAILFVIKTDPRQSAVSFASIRGISATPEEDEILFSMHSVFRIDDIKLISENGKLHEVHLTLTSVKDKQLHELTEQIRQESFPYAYGWYRLGLVLVQLNQNEKAAEICQMLLNQIKEQSDNHGSIVKFVGSTLIIRQQSLPANHPNMVSSYNNIGLVYYNMGDYPKALSYYEKALAIKQQSFHLDHSSLAASYNNIGVVYEGMKNYLEAYSYYECAVEIAEQSLSSNHPNLKNMIYNLERLKAQPTRSNSPVGTQEESNQLSTDSTPILTQPSTPVSLEADNLSVTKKVKQRDYENSVNKEVQPCNNKDIGLFVNKEHISDPEIYAVLTNPWVPSSNYKFPLVQMHQKMRSVCQHSWLQTYPWLGYSPILQDVLCCYCVLFKRQCSVADRARNSLGQLVFKPLSSLNKASEYLQLHEKTEYHIFSKQQAENFKLNFEHPNKAIDIILDNANQEQEATNRKILSSIIKCIMFIAKQNLAFRGHDDDGIDHKSSENLGNIVFALKNLADNHFILLGNFKELILFRADSGDKMLETHLHTAAKNAMYMSAEIQNQLINICGNMIKEEIVRHVIEKKKFYSIIADGTSDISGTEQLSLSIRYLSYDNDQIDIKEDFIGFTPVADGSAKGISEKIMDYLRAVGLDLAYLRGQGYDGCSVMSGHLGGVQKLISNIEPKAIYVHCASHSLDLAICDACDDRNIQLFFGTIKNIVRFISSSPKRQNLLKSAIGATSCDTKRKKLTKLVEHRWVEKHTSVLVFKQLFSGVVIFLEHMIESSDSETSANSLAYFKSVKDLDFIICLFVVSRVFAILKPYTEMLQSKNCELIQLYDNIQNVATHLAELKYDTTKFEELTAELEVFCRDNDIIFTLPRRNKYNNVNDYLKSIYKKFIDTTLSELGARFSEHQRSIIYIINLLPSNVVDKTLMDVENIFRFYESDLPAKNADLVKAEFELWQHKWKKSSADERTSNIISTLNSLLPIKSFYPNLYCLFEIFAVLPVTVATAERSFSTMKRIKTTLRNSIGDNRLSDLALIHIHRDIANSLDVEDIIDIF
ncbi:unnamed protein product, partial [Adineta ricciae]